MSGGSIPSNHQPLQGRPPCKVCKASPSGHRQAELKTNDMLLFYNNSGPPDIPKEPQENQEDRQEGPEEPSRGCQKRVRFLTLFYQKTVFKIPKTVDQKRSRNESRNGTNNGPQNNDKSPPRWDPEMPEMAPGWFQMAPEWPKMAPRWPKNGPRWPRQDGAKMVQERHKTAQ